MSGFEFPPPQKAQQGAGGEVEYADAPVGGRFIFPPPRVTDTSEAEENLRLFGQQLSAWGDLAEWSAETSRNQGQVLVDYGDRLDNKVESWAVPTIMPLSATINRWADPTFQLSDMMVPIMSGSTDPAGHNHTHTVSTTPRQLQRGAGTPGRIYYAFITPAINRAYEQLNFMVSEVAGTPCRMDIGVYVLDAATKALTRQVHVQDAAAGLPFAESVVTVRFPTWVATQGSYVMVAWLQHGEGNPRMILGLDDTPRPLPTEIQFPHKISAIHSGAEHTALPAVIDGSSALEVNFSGFWFTPYAELSESVLVALRAFVENWPDVGEAKRPWVHLTSPGVYSRGGHATAAGTGRRVSMYDTPLATDHVRIQSSVHEIHSSQPEIPRTSTWIIRGTNDMRSGVGLSLDNNEYRLIQWANTSVEEQWHAGSRPVVATVPQSPRAGDRVVIEYNDGVVDVWINGEHRIADQQVGGPVGAAGRFVGVQLERTGAFLTFYVSPWLGTWSARDVPQDSGDDEETGTEG